MRQSMGDVCWHIDYLPLVLVERLAADGDLHLAVQDLDQGVVRRRVLTEPLPLGESEEGHRALGFVHDRPAHDSPLLILNHILEDFDLRSNFIRQI